MGKEKFTRTKPHVNIGTIGHIDHGKTASTKPLKKKNVVSPLLLLTLNMKPQSVTMHTLTAPDTRTMSRT